MSKNIILKGILYCVTLVIIALVGNKAVDTYEYYYKLNELEQYVDVNFGEDCRIDTDNLLITDTGVITNVLDADGNHVSPLIAHYSR